MLIKTDTDMIKKLSTIGIYQELELKAIDEKKKTSWACVYNWAEDKCYSLLINKDGYINYRNKKIDIFLFSLREEKELNRLKSMPVIGIYQELELKEIDNKKTEVWSFDINDTVCKITQWATIYDKKEDKYYSVFIEEDIFEENKKFIRYKGKIIYMNSFNNNYNSMINHQI